MGAGPGQDRVVERPGLEPGQGRRRGGRLRRGSRGLEQGADVDGLALQAPVAERGGQGPGRLAIDVEEVAGPLAQVGVVAAGGAGVDLGAQPSGERGALGPPEPVERDRPTQDCFVPPQD